MTDLPEAWIEPDPPRHLSLWWDTLPDELAIADRPALPGDADADVVIVGAGYTGLWTAYYLLRHRPDLRVTVLEEKVAGFGASGRNGGWCSALFPASWEAIAHRSSHSGAVALQYALFDAVAEVGRVCEREGIDAHYARGGTVSFVRSATQRSRALESIGSARVFGFDESHYAWLDADGTAAIARPTRTTASTFTPHCAAIHPARLVRGLAQAVERLGGTIHERTRVVRIDPAQDGRPAQAVTESGTVRAEIVVRAVEGYTPRLPGHRRALAPVYSLMIATEPLPDDVWDRIGLLERTTFNDHRHLIIYGQRTADGRLAFGGRGAPYHFGSSITAAYDRDPVVFDELQRVLVDLFPAVRDARITHRWGGPLGVPRDWFAGVSLDRATGTATCGGYVGDGVGLSNLGGRTLADLILDRPTERTALPWVGHRSRPWEPEPLRWLGVTAGLRVMGSADPVEERTGRPALRARVFSRFTGGH